MREIRQGLLIAGLLLLVTGCSLWGRHEKFSYSPAPATPAAATADATNPLDNDYKISPADTLEINVFREDSLKSVLRVSTQGTIAFPLIGMVPVGGLTPQGAAHAIQERLAQGYLINPQVSVIVQQYSKRTFTVLGEVQKPGSYDMPDQQDVTVLQAIGMAGGYTRIANPSKVTLMRKLNNKDQTIQLNAKKMAAGNAESSFTVLPGDVITVAESMF